MAKDLLNALRRANRVVAILIGLLLLGCAALVLIDITLRQFGSSFGGTDEITGYVMAISTAWGMAFTMLELAHVRIDFLRGAAAPKGRAVLDLLSVAALATTVSVIGFECWPVVATTLKNSAHANTPLETPLYLVQIPWFAGWAWFAVMAWLTFFSAAVLVLQGRLQESESVIGAFAEQEAAV